LLINESQFEFKVSFILIKNDLFIILVRCLVNKLVSIMNTEIARNVMDMLKNNPDMGNAERFFFMNLLNIPRSPPMFADNDARNWLSQIVPLFNQESRFTSQLNNDSAYGYLYGLVQSGKSMSQIGIAFHDIVLKNRSTIWILQNSKSDELQALSNLNSLVGESSRNKNSWAAYNLTADVK
jgi:hypothetical protein